MRPNLLFHLSCLIATAIFASSCSPPDRVEITKTRKLSVNEQKPNLTASSQVRFRAAVPQGPSWTTPEGWMELPATEMRLANLRFGPNGEGECSVTRLPVGGVEANVSRWRGQMGLSTEVSEEEIAALPKRSFLGEQAVVVTLDGDYKGFGETEAKKNYRMMGVILSRAKDSVFVKMVGPKDLVTKNEDKFYSFCDSLNL